ncbi:DUF87 domain-containing protein [Phototrophicus methaneseepsis]|uniref:DUF87 domain-containing protein n=1 Tax=Phototrophicus methaneseepsis TaxID=2710758 RepID=A0A7S8E9I4_9CHLR|nr:DNA translocase FtsK [Phototrophicus methaneseepsis]QPC82835.1 DUF87 domain-containing protein [Phototrophicus methaneseepsis]
MSNEQAAISGILEFIGDIFGWGALAVPITMFAIGMWLIIRHFGDQAPTVDPIRVTGVVLGFVTLLVFFQWVDSFSYTTIATLDTQQNLQNLSQRLDQAWNVDHTGGGFVGAKLYLTLVANVGEIGAFFLMLFSFIIAGMLMTRLTMSEMLGFAVGMWRSLRDVTRQQAVQQRAKRLEREQRRALEAQKPNITVSDLAQPVLPQGATNALPAGESNPNPFGQDIRINLGGRTQDSQEPMTANANAQTQSASSGGLFSRLLGGNNGNDNNSSNDGNGDSSGIAAALTGGLIGGLFGGRNNDNSESVNNNDGQSLPANTTSTQQPAQPPAQLAQGLPAQQPLPSQPATAPQQQSNALPANGTQNMPAASMPPANGQQAQYAANGSTAANPNAASANTTPLTDSPFGQQSIPSQPQQPAAQQPPSTRADRLNELRMGPSSITPPAPTQGDVDAVVPESYNAFGRPADIPKHHTEKLPYDGMQSGQQGPTPASRLPSAQANANEAQQPQQQRLNVQPTINRPQPISTPVTNQSRPKPEWRLPDYRTLLSSGSEQEFDRELLLRQARIIEETLDSFGAPGRVVEVNTGPVITQFGVEPDYISSRGGKRQRVKVGAIAALDRDLQLALGARSIRVEAPVPGKGYVGVEVPNEESSLVSLRDVMESDTFQKSFKKNPLTIALGQSVSGAPVAADLSGMPHLLIAGATGSGKSVCVNSIITSIVALNDPDTVKFIMVDPKRVELTGYNGIPHLIAPVVTDVERIIGVLKWVTREMDDRYKRFSESGARNITDFNKHRDPTIEKMPYIVVIIDELADLMMIAPDETERTITRIAALARATGIHLVIATQRPSVDVVTGLIKANFPARIAFAVSDGTNSRVILDQPGAERLLGKGDMLYMSGNAPAPVRMQGVFVSDMEINNIVRYWKMQAINQPGSVQQMTNLGVSAKPDTTTHEIRPRGDRVRQQAFWDAANQAEGAAEPAQPPQPYRDATIGFDLPDDFGTSDVELDENAITGDTDEDDELYEQAVELVRRLNKASVSLLQRRLRIGYTRAARLIDVMEARGVVGGPKEGSSKPRDVLPV